MLIDLLCLTLAALIIGSTIIYAAMTGAMFDDARHRALFQAEVREPAVSAQAAQGDSPGEAASSAPPGED